MTALTRGPLPARVYWTRRLLALTVLVGLVLGGVQLVRTVTGGTDSPPDQAAPMAAQPSAEASAGSAAEPAEEETEAPTDKQRSKQKRRKANRKGKGPVLAEPEGPCVDSDVAVTPTVDEAVGGSPITFVLELRSVDAAACTWQVSPQSVTVKITSGKDDIWSTLQCPGAVPRKRVVLRSNVSTEIEVTWSARRSDEGCTGNTAWAMPGWYFVNAAALAGEPSDLHFEVTQPEPDVVTETVEPKPGKKGRKDEQRSGRRD